MDLSAPALEQRPYRRTKFLINPRFQLRFLAYMIGAALATIGVFYAAKVIFFVKVRQFFLNAGMPPDHLIFQFLSDQSRLMNLIFLAAALVECALLGALGLMLSHKVAGPLYRLNTHMLQVADGAHKDEVRFRKGD